jgi:hypothetical protein
MFAMDSLIFLPMKMSDRVLKPFLTGLRIRLLLTCLISRYPQLYIDGEFVGGLDIVKEMVENGEFDELIKTNGQTPVPA